MTQTSPREVTAALCCSVLDHTGVFLARPVLWQTGRGALHRHLGLGIEIQKLQMFGCYSPHHLMLMDYCPSCCGSLFSFDVVLSVATVQLVWVQPVHAAAWSQQWSTQHKLLSLRLGHSHNAYSVMLPLPFLLFLFPFFPVGLGWNTGQNRWGLGCYLFVGTRTPESAQISGSEPLRPDWSVCISALNNTLSSVKSVMYYTEAFSPHEELFGGNKRDLRTWKRFPTA